MAGTRSRIRTAGGAWVFAPHHTRPGRPEGGAAHFSGPGGRLAAAGGAEYTERLLAIRRQPRAQETCRWDDRDAPWTAGPCEPTTRPPNASRATTRLRKGPRRRRSR